jgi:hypothetical protein
MFLSGPPPANLSTSTGASRVRKERKKLWLEQQIFSKGINEELTKRLNLLHRYQFIYNGIKTESYEDMLNKATAFYEAIAHLSEKMKKKNYKGKFSDEASLVVNNLYELLTFVYRDKKDFHASQKAIQNFIKIIPTEYMNNPSFSADNDGIGNDEKQGTQTNNPTTPTSVSTNKPKGFIATLLTYLLEVVKRALSFGNECIAVLGAGLVLGATSGVAYSIQASFFGRSGNKQSTQTNKPVPRPSSKTKSATTKGNVAQTLAKLCQKELKEAGDAAENFIRSKSKVFGYTTDPKVFL